MTVNSAPWAFVRSRKFSPIAMAISPQPYSATRLNFDRRSHSMAEQQDAQPQQRGDAPGVGHRETRPTRSETRDHRECRASHDHADPASASVAAATKLWILGRPQPRIERRLVPVLVPDLHSPARTGRPARRPPPSRTRHPERIPRPAERPAPTTASTPQTHSSPPTPMRATAIGHSRQVPPTARIRPPHIHRRPDGPRRVAQAATHRQRKHGRSQDRRTDPDRCQPTGWSPTVLARRPIPLRPIRSPAMCRSGRGSRARVASRRGTAAVAARIGASATGSPDRYRGQFDSVPPRVPRDATRPQVRPPRR